MFTKLKASDARPKRLITVKRISRFERTPEWHLMKPALDKGLKIKEGLSVSFTPEEQAKYGLERQRVVVRFLKKYVKALGMPYTVKSYVRELGTSYLVEYPEPVPVKARKLA